MSSKRRLLSALLLAIGLCGCAYRLGTTLPPELKTVYIPAVENRTSEPDLATLSTRALQQEFQRDGTLTLRGEKEADMVVALRIAHFRLDPVAYERDNPRAAGEYRLTLVAEITATETSSGRVLLNSVVTGDSRFQATSDLITAKRSALPEATRDLAHEAVSAVISMW